MDDKKVKVQIHNFNFFSLGTPEEMSTSDEDFSTSSTRYSILLTFVFYYDENIFQVWKKWGQKNVNSIQVGQIFTPVF